MSSASSAIAPQSSSPSPAVPGEYWTWRDYSIHYVKAGQGQQGRPPLLLVHGFGASTDHWRKNIAELQQDFEVWAIDLLGFGRSQKAEAAYGWELWRDQIHDFITQVIGQPVVVAGNSIGGYICFALAATHPESVRGLVSLNSVGRFSDGSAPAGPAPSPSQKLLGQAGKWLINQDAATWLLFKFVQRKAYIRKVLAQVYVNQSEVTPQLIDEIYRPACDEGAARVFALIFRAAAKGQTLDELMAQMRTPLLAIWGEGDPWVNCRARGEKYAQFYGDRLTQVYLNSGHCPHDDTPTEFNQALRDWVLATVA
jgi:pimeloyl-ACP methyl ester carboxylesterase